MNRFWVFPIVLSLAGALFVLFAALEGIAPFLLLLLAPTGGVGISFSASNFHEILRVMSWGGAAGAVCGLIAGGFDLVRNGRGAPNKAQLAKNIAWCLLYAHAFIVVDMGLVGLWVWRVGMGSPDAEWAFLFVFLPALLWLVAIAWGTVRTICSNDVLIPRVLGAKLKRSARVHD